MAKLRIRIALKTVTDMGLLKTLDSLEKIQNAVDSIDNKLQSADVVGVTMSPFMPAIRRDTIPPVPEDNNDDKA